MMKIMAATTLPLLANAASCSSLCEDGGYGKEGFMSGTAPGCGGKCEDCGDGHCYQVQEGDVDDYGSGCWGGDKVCCCTRGEVVEPGSDWTDLQGTWASVTTGQDISMSVAIGIAYTDSSTITETDQQQFSYALGMEGGAEFLGVGGKVSETFTASLSHTYSEAVMTSTQRSETNTCQAKCARSDLPDGSPGWDLFQWELRGTGPNGVVSDQRCDFVCVPQPMTPMCPLGCCKDTECQTCYGTEMDCPETGEGGGEDEEQPPPDAEEGGEDEEQPPPAAEGGEDEEQPPQAAEGGEDEEQPSPAAEEGGEDEEQPPPAPALV